MVTNIYKNNWQNLLKKLLPVRPKTALEISQTGREKSIHREELPKKVELGQFADLSRWEAWQKRGGGVFEGGRGVDSQCTPWKCTWHNKNIQFFLNLRRTVWNKKLKFTQRIMNLVGSLAYSSDLKSNSSSTKHILRFSRFWLFHDGGNVQINGLVSIW